MDWRIKITSLVLLVLLCGCGGSSSSGTSSSVPTAQDPTSGTQQSLPTPTPTPNPNQPNLSQAQPFALPNNSDDTGLDAIFGTISLPLVGDPLVDMFFTGWVSGQTAINGTLRLAVEDNTGLTVRDFPSFAGTGYYDSQTLNMIFADDEDAMLVAGVQSGGTLNGTIYYRVRQSGDTECESITYTCVDQNGNPVPVGDCPPPPDTVTPCEQYMSTSNSNVIILGTFQQASFSSWFTQTN